MLYPAGADAESPDVSWSYTGFSMFRKWLARTEGLAPDAMSGFGGTRPWSDTATPLAPLLDHADDDGPDLTPGRCAAMLPRLREIAARYEGDTDPAHRRRVDDVRELIAVLEHCVTHDVGLVFG
ncbi:hypothetical protein [Streptomyces sp. RK9]|uniref:hypothetical protein n=1 Tax=Streptomyces sp. RK9 TaxID=3239284 RepID=UPI00386D6C93